MTQRSFQRTDPAARNLTRESVEQAEALEWPPVPAAPAALATPPAKPATSFTLAAVYDGYPLTVAFTGTIEQLPAIVARLRSVGAQPPVSKIEWSYTPEGLPICPKHGTVMRKRERQGDTWYSHNMGSEREECYCRGYPGKDSPGYER